MKGISKVCISNEAEWVLPDTELLLQTSVSPVEERGRDRDEPGRASCSLTSGGAKSLSSALFWSQSHAPYMVRVGGHNRLRFFLSWLWHIAKLGLTLQG